MTAVPPGERAMLEADLTELRSLAHDVGKVGDFIQRPDLNADNITHLDWIAAKLHEIADASVSPSPQGGAMNAEYGPLPDEQIAWHLTHEGDDVTVVAAMIDVSPQQAAEFDSMPAIFDWQNDDGDDTA